MVIEKVVKKGVWKDVSEIEENLRYWLSKAPEERVSAVEHLRKQRHGEMGRIQRCVRVVDLGQEED